MGGVICQANDRKRNPENKENKDGNNYRDLTINNQYKGRRNSQSKIISRNEGNLKFESKTEFRKLNKISIDTNLLVSRGNNNPKDNYKRIKILGQGSFGTVFLVKHKIINNYFAMKVIKKISRNEQEEISLMNEINMVYETNIICRIILS